MDFKLASLFASGTPVNLHYELKKHFSTGITTITLGNEWTGRGNSS